jgi:hypothetical protein
MFVGDEFIWPPLVEVSLSIAWARHFVQGPLRKVELVPLIEIPDGGDLITVYRRIDAKKAAGVDVLRTYQTAALDASSGPESGPYAPDFCTA